MCHEFSGSGGYSDHIFKFAAMKLFGEGVEHLENPDFREVTLQKDGQVLLKFAIANGFRNIQNLVQKLKRGKTQYHFVEVMACPSGCLNGGAQVRPPIGTPIRELMLQLEELYRQLSTSVPDNSETRSIYTSFFDGQQTDKAKMFLVKIHFPTPKLAECASCTLDCIKLLSWNEISIHCLFYNREIKCLHL